MTQSENSSQAREVLQTVFGYQSFRGDQAAIVEQLIAGHSAVVLMPTGAENPCVIKFLRLFVQALVL